MSWLSLLYCTESGQEEKGARLKKFDKEDEMMKLYELHMTFLEKWKAAASPKAAIEAIGQKKVSSAPCTFWSI